MNSEEKNNDFLKDKDGAGFDIPTVKRRGFREQDKNGGEDEGHAGASRGYFVRRSLREREVEEEQRHGRALKNERGNASDEDDDEYSDYDYSEDEGRKAPAVVRVFAWIALLAIFFAGGYVGANYLFRQADQRGARVGNVVGSGAEVRQVPGMGEASYKLFMPLATGGFEEREIKIRRGLPEEDIHHLLTVYVDGLKELTEFEPGTQVISIFRSGDWLYVDMTADFQKSLKTLGRDKSTMALTGLVRTVQENFHPVKKVKFYVEGKESRDKNPVDIENAWELKG